MRKLLLATILLSGCKDTNYAEVLVKGRVPDAQCSSSTLDGISVTKCKIKDQDVIAIYGGGYPFQAWDLKKPETQPNPPVNPPYVTADAGVK